MGTIFAALLGLAFGSFLNVFLARFPEGESIVSPRSHCRHCEHTLAWWENLPVLSWLILRGRCRQCHAWIGIRYPLVELAVALLWIGCWLRSCAPLLATALSTWPATGPAVLETPHPAIHAAIQLCGNALVCWLLTALAFLDAEYFWLPDWLTLPGIASGFLFVLLETWSNWFFDQPINLPHAAWHSLLAILGAAGLILAIRLAYWIVRRQEGIGLGDAKLMALLGAWFGLRGALETFILAALGASAVAILWLLVLAIRRDTDDWAKMPLPLGTFLCAAAIVEVFFPGWFLNAGRLGL